MIVSVNESIPTIKLPSELAMPKGPLFPRQQRIAVGPGIEKLVAIVEVSKFTRVTTFASVPATQAIGDPLLETVTTTPRSPRLPGGNGLEAKRRR